jgi:hypothetical protein
VDPMEVATCYDHAHSRPGCSHPRPGINLSSS